MRVGEWHNLRRCAARFGIGAPTLQGQTRQRQALVASQALIEVTAAATLFGPRDILLSRGGGKKLLIVLPRGIGLCL